ncbi:hypothetical protein KCU88_g410, partial [Aureobasidium melanogenum]
MTSRVISARYRPLMKLSVLRNISRSRDWPIGLYFRLNLSNRWNESVWACISRVSILKSYAVRLMLSKTSRNVNCFPSRSMTTSSGHFFILLLMNRNRCFWFMHAEWCTVYRLYRPSRYFSQRRHRYQTLPMFIIYLIYTSLVHFIPHIVILWGDVALVEVEIFADCLTGLPGLFRTAGRCGTTILVCLIGVRSRAAGALSMSPCISHIQQGLDLLTNSAHFTNDTLISGCHPSRSATKTHARSCTMDTFMSQQRVFELVGQTRMKLMAPSRSICSKRWRLLSLLNGVPHLGGMVSDLPSITMSLIDEFGIDVRVTLLGRIVIERVTDLVIILEFIRGVGVTGGWSICIVVVAVAVFRTLPGEWFAGPSLLITWLWLLPQPRHPRFPVIDVILVVRVDRHTILRRRQPALWSGILRREVKSVLAANLERRRVTTRGQHAKDTIRSIERRLDIRARIPHPRQRPIIWPEVAG